MPPAQWTTTRFSNGCATTGFDCFEGSRWAARLFFGYSVVISALLQGLTQTVTQTRKRAGGYRRTQWMPHRAESMQKRRKALRHNAFRRSSYLHTQEVTGSSPAVSTKKVQGSQRSLDFFIFIKNKFVSNVLVTVECAKSGSPAYIRRHRFAHIPSRRAGWASRKSGLLRGQWK